MTFYSDMAATARGLLTRFGQTVTVARTAGTFDPVTGTTPTATASSFTGKGAIFDYETRQIDGTSIQAGDKLLLLEAGNAPQINDTVTIGNITMQVVSFSTLAPAGEVVMYDVQLRS